MEKTAKAIFTLCGFSAVLLCAVITGFLCVSGLPAIGKIGILDFFFGKTWASTANPPSFGILPFFLTSLCGAGGALLLSVPTGILCAALLATTEHKKVASAVRTCVDLLSGIPSVVYGLVGMILIVPWVRETFDLPDGANLFSAVLVLAVMILPTVISVAETAVRAVPREYSEASLALGANRTETIFRVVLPAAKSGILTAVILGVGKCMGEAMAVMMVSGNVANMPGIFRSVRFLTTAIATEMSYSSGLQREALFSIALVLFLLIFLISFLLNVFLKGKRGDRNA